MEGGSVLKGTAEGWDSTWTVLLLLASLISFVYPFWCLSDRYTQLWRTHGAHLTEYSQQWCTLFAQRWKGSFRYPLEPGKIVSSHSARPDQPSMRGGRCRIWSFNGVLCPWTRSSLPRSHLPVLRSLIAYVPRYLGTYLLK